jgi:hypothetical protein
VPASALLVTFGLRFKAAISAKSAIGGRLGY